MSWPSPSPPADDHGHIRIVGCVPVEFAAHGRRFSVCTASQIRRSASSEPRPLAGPRWQYTSDGFQDHHEMAVLLRDADVSRLRSLLADETWHVHGLRDFAVRDAVARLIQCRTLVLLVSVAAETVIRPGKAVNVPIGSSSSDANRLWSTPSSLRPAKAAEIAPIERATAPDPIASPLDQDRQALVLLLAAVHGMPFCEECARRQRDAVIEA